MDRRRRKPRKRSHSRKKERSFSWVSLLSVPLQLAGLITAAGIIFAAVTPNFDSFDDSELTAEYLGFGILAPFWETDEIPCRDFTATYYVDQYPIKTVSGECYDWNRNQLEGKASWADVALILPPNIALEGEHNLRVRFEWKQLGITIHESVLEDKFNVEKTNDDDSGVSYRPTGATQSDRIAVAFRAPSSR